MKPFSVAHKPLCLLVDLEVKNVDPSYCVQATGRALNRPSWQGNVAS